VSGIKKWLLSLSSMDLVKVIEEITLLIAKT
jgi:hypothetical protein